MRDVDVDVVLRDDDVVLRDVDVDAGVDVLRDETVEVEVFFVVEGRVRGVDVDVDVVLRDEEGEEVRFVVLEDLDVEEGFPVEDVRLDDELDRVDEVLLFSPPTHESWVPSRSNVSPTPLHRTQLPANWVPHRPRPALTYPSGQSQQLQVHPYFCHAHPVAHVPPTVTPLELSRGPFITWVRAQLGMEGEVMSRQGL